MFFLKSYFKYDLISAALQFDVTWQFNFSDLFQMNYIFHLLEVEQYSYLPHINKYIKWTY